MAVDNAGADAIVAATPASRDRYIDALRVFALGGVILGHYIMGVVSWAPGEPISFTNILELEPLTRWGTLILQVMPLFFAVGGFSHAVAWRSLARRGGGYADFVAARVGRLIKPALIYVGVWMVAGLDHRRAVAPDRAHPADHWPAAVVHRHLSDRGGLRARPPQGSRSLRDLGARGPHRGGSAGGHHPALGAERRREVAQLRLRVARDSPVGLLLRGRRARTHRQSPPRPRDVRHRHDGAGAARHRGPLRHLDGELSRRDALQPHAAHRRAAGVRHRAGGSSRCSCGGGPPLDCNGPGSGRPWWCSAPWR